ncbi:MAG: hypothetical protein K1X40_12815 [Chitinophagales bacterium]|nr:hypothetical protein [Chitinophagales bacterium]
MKRIILALCSLAISASAIAQVPGYMGKRLQIYASVEPTFDFRYITDGLDYYLQQPEVTIPTEYGNYGIGVTPGVGIEYTLNNTFVMGADVKWKQAKAQLHMYYNTASNPDIPYGYLGEGKISGMLTGFYFKIYSHRKHGYIAPIGRYHQFEILTGKFSMQESGYSSTDFYAVDYQEYYSNLSLQASELTPVASLSQLNFDPHRISYLRYVFGGETVLFDKVPADIGIQFAMPLSFVQYGDYDNGIDKGGYDYAYTVRKSMNGAMAVGIVMRFGIFAI